MFDFDYAADPDYEHGICDMCECPLDADGDCQSCAPRVALEDTPVRASFTIAPPVRGIPGAVTFSGWSA